MYWGDHHDERHEREELYCLQLFSWESSIVGLDPAGNPRKMGPNPWFLVLKPSLAVLGAFERIGIGMKEECIVFEEAESVTIKIV